MTTIHVQTGKRIYVKELNKILVNPSDELDAWMASSKGEFRGSGQGRGIETYWDDGRGGPYIEEIDNPEYLQYVARTYRKKPRSPKESAK